MQRVGLKLELATFDPAPFAPYLLQCREEGLPFTSMAVVGDTSENQRALYELNKTCSADIPERGPFYTFDEYLARRLDPEIYDPRGVIFVVDEGAWVGFSSTSIRSAEDTAVSMMTGIVRTHRGRGISLALKVLAIAFARSSGVRWLRASHHPANTAAIAMNRRLGFVDDDS